MALYLRLFPKPYILTAKDEADYKSLRLDPTSALDDVRELIEQAAPDEEIVVKTVLSDLAFPVPFGFRKSDWSAWMVHPLPDDE